MHSRAGTEGDEIVDLHLADARLPAEMIAFLKAGKRTLSLAQEILHQAPPQAVYPRGAVKLRAPLLRPGKIICIGQNYLEHALESNASRPPYPIIFAKYANSLIGPRRADRHPGCRPEA